MQPHEQIVAESAWLYRFLTRGPARVSLVGETVRVERLSGDALTEIPVGSIDAITVRPSWFWNRLTIRIADGTERSIGGLGEKEAIRVHDAVLGEADRHASSLGNEMTLLDQRLSQLLAGECYLRHSKSGAMHAEPAVLLKKCGGLVRKRLEQAATEALSRLAPLEFAEGFEMARERANNRFVSKRSPDVIAAVQEALPVPLTSEQAEAIATDEDATLVLAGAGTGKTSVMVGKVAHLVRNQGVSPREVLVLAFNRKAASEIRERLPRDLSTAGVSTFHAFGRRVIADVEKAEPAIAKFAGDESKLHATLKGILNELLDDPTIANFIASYHGAYESAFDFDTQDEYDSYIRSVELKTLSGARVKSFEELEIANYLTKHGVKFCYERPYEKRTATPEYSQYHPDFFLPDYDIYIEHYALDERGRPPRHWKGYKERVEWHRRTHEKYGTKLIETYSWQHREGILLPELRARLKREGVRFERVSQRELVLQLARQLIEWLARLLAKFLNHVKTNGLSSEELRARASKRGTLWRNEGFLEVFEQVRARYEQRLQAEGKLDFHDLINRAADYIREGIWGTPYRYVLVDEFQDISAGRMKLLEALRRDDTAYFLVGDDWQSINRFAGSDVGLVRNCGCYLGHVEERELSQTFRFADGILTPSTEFVRRNPEQWQRTLTSVSGAEDKGITVVADDDPAAGLQRVREDIEASARSKGHSVLVLGRYNTSKDALPSKLPWEEFSTVHGAKGREADYVVVLDLKDGRWGFPSRIEDNSLLELVLPAVSERAYPFAEERRLFYVAMTRARIGAYLITDPVRPSTFVTELLQQSGSLRQIGGLALECPRCLSGRLSQNGKNLRCSNYLRCQHLAPQCPNCKSGYAMVDRQNSPARCTNPACNRPPTVCPKCSMGVLLPKRSVYGPFWGCSEFESEPSCRYRENIESGSVGTHA